MAEQDKNTKKTVTAKPKAAAKKPDPKVIPVTKKPDVPKTAAKPAEKPAAKPVAKPAEKPVTAKPVAKPAEKPVTAKPAAKPAEKPKATAEAKPAEKPKATAEVKPVAKAVEKSAEKPKATVKPSPEVRTKKMMDVEKKAEKLQKKSKKNRDGISGFFSYIFKSKVRTAVSAAIAFVLVLAIVLGIVFGAKSCAGDNSGAGGGAETEEGRLSDVDIAVPSKEGTYLAGSSISPASEYSSVGLGKENLLPDTGAGAAAYDTSYKTNTTVGYTGRVIGTVERNIPETVRDEGLAAYPGFGYTLSTVIGGEADKVAARNALIYESSYLTATGTWNGGAGGFNWMDKDGYLYSGTTAEPVATLDKSGHHRRLYKHTASQGLYGGDVSDDEEGIIKQVTMRPRVYNRGYGVTGVYAPAGELIKITLSEKDMNATGGIVIHIGQALYNGKANNIWTAKNQMQRFPVIMNTMTLDKNTTTYDEAAHTYTGYVGSFVGGPLYIRNENVEFTATISGGVAYSHFILGYTTKEEFDENAKSSAPYFDLEVWDCGVLHSGPKRQAARFTYEDIYKVAVLWDKVATVSTSNSAQGIVFLYDPFVAAGAAVAFPGQGSVNCPEGWMGGSLNYNALVTSGSWGNFHEYHHNFQGYGVGNGGEVTNNGMTLVSYALFTKISAKRGLGNFGAQNLGGWNDYTSASWSLNDILKISRGEQPNNGKQGLSLYSTLLHNFGPDAYIQAKVTQQRQRYGESYVGYLKAWQDVTHNDMTYYFKDILRGIDAIKAEEVKYDGSKFVPVSCVYQTGRSYMYDGEKRYITTMQPYQIAYGAPYLVDLNPYSAPGNQYAGGSVVIPEGFSYTIKNVTQPEHGSVVADNENRTFTYVPDTGDKSATSGEIKVTLGITKDDGAFEVDDVDLVLEFELSHEMNKNVLDRTTYTYSADKMYSDAQEAYENGFDGYTTVEQYDHTNPTQHANTDIWYCTPSTLEKFPNADPDKHVAKENTISTVEGKLYFEDAGKYRIYLRGRLNCAVYYSLDGGKTYELGGAIKDASAAAASAYFRTDDENTYFDVELEAHSWVYFKEVLIVQNINGSQASFIGLGARQWEEPRFTMVEKYYNAKGQEVAGMDAEDYSYTVVKYYDYMGIEVTEEEANSTDPVPPVIKGANDQPYVNAYRCSYEPAGNGDFTSEYMYVRDYTYNYTDNVMLGNDDKHVVVEQCANLNLHTGWGGNDHSVVLDGITDQGGKMQLHTGGAVNAAKPFTLVVDLGEVCTANRLVLYSQPGRADPCFPKSLNLYASTDGHNYTLVKSFTALTFSGSAQTLDFDDTEMRYYKIEVTEATSGHLIIRELQMWHTYEITGGACYAPDNEKFTYSGEWSAVQAYSTFGHSYTGKAGATLSFEFTGTRVGFRSTEGLGGSFEVYIDGAKVDSVALKAFGYAPATYISNVLTAGAHRVELRCTGDASIDSVIIFP